MKDYGPLPICTTARSEGKHREFMNDAVRGKNFINLPSTLAVKSQKRLANRYGICFYTIGTKLKNYYLAT